MGAFIYCIYCNICVLQCTVSNTVQLSMQLAQLQADIISHRSLTHQFEAVP